MLSCFIFIVVTYSGGGGGNGNANNAGQANDGAVFPAFTIATIKVQSFKPQKLVAIFALT